MAKTKTTFFCQNCGVESVKWVGKCPGCHEWNTYVEEIVTKPDANRKIWDMASGNNKPNKPILIQNVSNEQQIRITTPDGELNRVLGGGIVPGSLVLCGLSYDENHSPVQHYAYP